MPVAAVRQLGCAVVAAAALAGCIEKRSGPLRSEALEQASWAKIEARARGQKLTWAMWQGDPNINDYVQHWVTPRLEERFGITLRTVSAQGNEIVAQLMAEIEAGRTRSEYDLVWINGETFFQLRRVDALYGPFTDRLPHARLIDFDSPFIGRDFQQPIEGYECPWGNVQMAFIYDQARVGEPPTDPAALLEWAKAHPGRFTWSTDFTGLTFLKVLLIHFAGGRGALDGPFDHAKYGAASTKLWAYIKALSPFLWKRGETFPARLAKVHQLFALGELDFTMSNNDAEVDNKVEQGLFPKTARAYVWAPGTIQNAHYIGIPQASGQKAAAMVVIDFLISPEAQFEKLKPSVWGDGTVLDVARLPEPWKSRFAAVPSRQRAPKRADIAERALQEPASEYMLRLDRDFRAEIIEAPP